MGNISSTSGSEGKAIQGTPGQSPDTSLDDAIERGDLQRGREHAQAAEKSDLVSLGPAARKLQNTVSTFAWKNTPNKSEEQADVDVRDLLNVQDGECGLYVRAIAWKTNAGSLSRSRCRP